MAMLEHNHVLRSDPMVNRTNAGAVRSYVERMSDFMKRAAMLVCARDDHGQNALCAVVATPGH
jgi:hypothetical protein